MPPAAKVVLPNTVDGWVKLSLLMCSIGASVWRVSAMHTEAMTEIRAVREDVDEVKVIAKSNADQLDLMVTHDELDRELLRHSSQPHPGAVSDTALEFIREDLAELKAQIRAMHQ